MTHLRLARLEGGRNARRARRGHGLTNTGKAECTQDAHDGESHAKNGLIFAIRQLNAVAFVFGLCRWSANFGRFVGPPVFNTILG